MLTNVLKFSFLVLTLFLLSCSKSSDNAAESSFTWTFKGKNYATKNNTAYIYSLGAYVIVAGNGTEPARLERRVSFFNLRSFNASTYPINSTSNNKLSYVDDDGNELMGIAGTLNITASSNNVISGDFSCTLVGPAGETNGISGSFNNVPVKP
jgi:P pilus assembly chaperone PapD